MSVIDGAAGTRTYQYARHGALEEESIGGSGILAGQTLVQSFDSWLRPRARSASFGSQTLGTTTYGYGASGAIRSVNGNGFTASYYDHPQKQTLETVTYTKGGEQAPLLQSQRVYDAANRLTRITTHVNDGGVQKPVDHHGYAYDALNRIQTHGDLTGSSWNYGYNATGEVTAAAKKLADGVTDYFGRNYRYHYDGTGNRTSVEQSRSGGASRVFSYTSNVLNQYTGVTHPGFVDLSGTANPLAEVTVNGDAAARQAGYFYKELSEDNATAPQWLDATVTDGTTTTSGSLPLPAASSQFSYDADGNLTADGQWTYRWDAENRLTGCERSPALVASGAPYLRLEYAYDYQGKRIRSAIYTSESATTPSELTVFVFDGWKCLAELNASGSPVRQYTWGLDLAGSADDEITGAIGALLWVNDVASTKTHIYLYDKNGNVSGLLDTTTRKRSASYEYDAFGQQIASYGEYAKANRFTWSTKYTEFYSKLCYYGYRWYSPEGGRWISRDPIGEEGGENLYEFVKNDGLNRLDVFGLEETPIDGGFSMDWNAATTSDPSHINEAGFFADVAGGVKGRGNPDAGHGTTGADLLNYLKKLSKCHCIRNLRIAGHGSGSNLANGINSPKKGKDAGFHGDVHPWIVEPGYDSLKDWFYLNKNPGVRNPRYDPDSRSVQDLIGAISEGSVKFCKQSTISIMSCRVDPAFAQRLAAATNSKVVSNNVACHADTNGHWWATRDKSVDMTRGDWGFSESDGGQPPRPIGNNYYPPRF